MKQQLVLLFFTLIAYASIVGANPPHELFDAVLADHVVKGQVNYNAIKTDRRFHDYVSWLENADADQLETTSEKLAFWINAYNALAIKGIIEGRSPSSLFGRAKYFLSTKNRLAGMDITLDKLEKEIIIPMGEPRIHFAIVCASYSCPKLRSEAYVASRLNQQLDDNAREFINDPVKNEIDRDKKILRVSKIFDWFEEDFTQHSSTVSAYIAQFVDNTTVAKDLGDNKYKIKYLKYNWSLNGSFDK